MLEKQIKVSDIVLAVRDDENSGEPVIFLHFGGANLMMWQKAIPYFTGHYRLVLVDLRGHGKSDSPATGYHMDDMAEDIVGVMEYLDITEAHIIGSSLGAEVGLSLAANFPGRIFSLVCDGALSSEFGPFGTWEGSPAEFSHYVTSFLDKMQAAPEKTYPSIDAYIVARRTGLVGAGWWNAQVEAMERYGVVKLEDGTYTGAFRKHARLDYFRHYFDYRFEQYYPRVQFPLLMLPAEEVFSNERETAAMEGLCKLAPSARIVRLSGWQHPYGWLLDPEGACQAISGFLLG